MPILFGFGSSYVLCWSGAQSEVAVLALSFEQESEKMHYLGGPA